MEIILSTRNRSKIDQIKGMLSGLETVLSLSEAGIEGDAVEDGQTLEENAFKKAPLPINKLANGPWPTIRDFLLMLWTANLAFMLPDGLVTALLPKTSCDLRLISSKTFQQRITQRHLRQLPS